MPVMASHTRSFAVNVSCLRLLLLLLLLGAAAADGLGELYHKINNLFRFLFLYPSLPLECGEEMTGASEGKQ